MSALFRTSRRRPALFNAYDIYAAMRSEAMKDPTARRRVRINGRIRRRVIRGLRAESSMGEYVMVGVVRFWGDLLEVYMAENGQWTHWGDARHD